MLNPDKECSASALSPPVKGIHSLARPVLGRDAGNCTCSSQVCLPEQREQWSSVPGAWPVVGAYTELAVSMAVAISSVGQPVGSSVLFSAAGSVPPLWVFS